MEVRHFGTAAGRSIPLLVQELRQHLCGEGERK